MSQLGPCENCIPLLQLSEYCTSEFIIFRVLCNIFHSKLEQKTAFSLKNTPYLTRVVYVTQSSLYNQRLEGSR